ncbi:MAG: hypothetical protein IH856_12405 [Deltaproteobacteria bacterium]|nr:hypothetical protein [Deltaproteobacteria bacterium]
MAFLTLEDPNAKIKGSRDPLGIQPVWAAFGRHVVTNLTTQSTSVRGFTILLLGRYFAARLIEDGTVSQEEALNVFLRMEQIGAYIRYVAHKLEGNIRGIERVMTFLEEGRGKVNIQSDRRGMILSDQKTYGLWGLYSVPARTSGMIPEGSFGVTEKAREFIERNYMPSLESVTNPLLRLLSRGGTLDTRTKEPVFVALTKILSETFTPEEIEFYGHYLRDGLEVKTTSRERQARFRDLLEANIDLDAQVGREEVLQLSETAQGVDVALAEYLKRITHLEALLAPAAVIFDYILTQSGQRPKDVAAKLVKHWGGGVPNLDPSKFREILPEIRETSTSEISAAVARSHEALTTGNYEEAVFAVMDWNTKVMAVRNAAPWARLAEDGRIDVRYRGIERLLPDADDLPMLWHNSYFIDSLKSVTRQLRNESSR